MTAPFPVATLMAALACSPEQASPVLVIAEHEAPVVASTYQLEELRVLARQAGYMGHPPVLGFYAATFGYALEPSGTDGCPGGIVVRVTLGARHVEVASDAMAWGCQPEAISKHYLSHAAADDLALSDLARQVQNSADRLPPQKDQVLALTTMIDTLLPSYDTERAQALASSDNEPELSRLRAACQGSWPGSL